MSEDLVVVVTGGAAPSPGVVLGVPLNAPVVAADGGLEHARALGLEVSVAVGDFDSASVASVRDAEAAGTRIERHPAHKDATDLELALETALTLSPNRILVLAGEGGRLDHLAAVLLLLAAPRWAGVEIDARIGMASVHVIRDSRRLSGRRGDVVSLLPVHGPAEGVVTEGLDYPLRGETLDPGSSRGVSNVLSEDEATVSLERGVILAVLPGPEGGDPS